MFPLPGKRTWEQVVKKLVLAVVLALVVLGGGVAASDLTGNPAYACTGNNC
jgi:hypothetical protein